MNQNSQKSVIRQFYEEELQKLYELTDSFSDFFSSCRIGSVQLLSIDTDEGIDCIDIERIQQVIPQVVADTYNRHLWYSQHSLSNLYLLRIPEEPNTFALLQSSERREPPLRLCALLIEGFANDGWDNSGRFIEVFDERGEFLGSGFCDYEGVEWMDRQLKGNDFHTSAPPCVVDTPDVQKYHEPIWLEEQLSQSARRIETQGSITRYIL